MKSNSTNSNRISFKQKGQSLIETIVAIFILTTGLASGLGLAIFAFGASSDILERITATGLAREGIEVVRRNRDSNWLAGTLADCDNGQKCYPTWLLSPYNIQGSSSGTVYRLVFDPTRTASHKWDLLADGPTTDDRYRLYVQSPNGGLSHIQSVEPTNYFRKIEIIQSDTAPPYTAISPLILVRVSVWWHGKNCPQITYLNSPADTHCKIVTEEYLTNWKNY